MSRIRFSSGSPCRITGCAYTPNPLRPRPLRPASRARRLRCRLRRSRQGSPLARYRPPRAAGADEPRAPRRLRLRSQYRRRRRHPDPDAGPLLPQGGSRLRIPLPAERLVRRRPRVPAEGGRCARGRSRRRSSASCAEEGQQVLGWRDVPTDDSALGPRAVAAEPVFRQLFVGAVAPAASVADGDCVRAQAVRDPQADRARSGSAWGCRPRRSSRSTS